MDIAVEPEIYCPIIDDTGVYIDRCPSFIKYGIKCPCGTWNEHVFDTKSKFKQHILGVKHKRWIKILNAEKYNHYKECIEMKNVLKQQREIIGKMEIEMSRLRNINKFLEDKIFQNEKSNNTVTDLLDLDI